MFFKLFDRKISPAQELYVARGKQIEKLQEMMLLPYYRIKRRWFGLESDHSYRRRVLAKFVVQTEEVQRRIKHANWVPTEGAIEIITHTRPGDKDVA